MGWLHSFLDLDGGEKKIEEVKKAFVETKDFSSFMISVFKRKFGDIDLDNEEQT